MHTLTLTTKSLRAAMKCAAVKYIRSYLNGVLVQSTEVGRDIYTVSTNGHILFAGKQDAQWDDGNAKPGPWSIIIPSDTIKTALRGYKLPAINLTIGDDGQPCQLGNVLFTPHDATFPDWRRVTPYGPMSGEAGQYNPEFLATAQDALCEWHENKHSRYVHLAMNGKTSSAVMTGRNDTAYVVLMPWRADDTGFPPFIIDDVPQAEPEALAA